MSDLISLSRGAEPWRPTSSTELVEVYKTYDGPLLGILSQDSVRYLFECIYGHIESLSVWLYSYVPEGALSLLDDHKGDPFDQLVRQIQTNVPGRIALVIEGEGVVACADAMDFPGALGTALNELVERYKEMVERFSRTENEVNDLANTPADLVSA